MNEILIKLGHEMTEHAVSIKTIYEVASGIDKDAADRMILGIKEYFDGTGILDSNN